MAHTLVSFLGALSARFPDQERRGYRSATYRFPDGSEISSAFFTLTLLQHLRKSGKNPPDRLVLLGTSGSMWDAFGLEVLGDDLVEWEELAQAATADTVEQSALNELVPRLGTALGVVCEPVIIPYARDLDSQIGILQHLNARLRPHEHVTLDLTHGLRHLPLLGLMSALLLEATGTAIVEDIYYGALDLTGKSGPGTPVLQLNGLARVGVWLGAMRIFRHTSDYGVFAPLLEQDGVSSHTAGLLRTAAFLEQVNRVGDANGTLKRFRRELAEETGSMPLTRLFRPMLDSGLAWSEQPDHYRRMRHLALAALEGNDYVRTATLGFEAFLLRLPQPPLEWTGSDPRSATPAKDYYEQVAVGPDRTAVVDAVYETYRRLRDLRNTLVHGSPPRLPEVRQCLNSPETFVAALREWFIILLPDQARGIATLRF